MMTEAIGEHGISETDLTDRQEKIEKAAQQMAEQRGNMAWRDLPYTQADTVREILDYAEWVRKHAKAFVVLGIGGSALGPMAVQQALNHPHYNELPRKKRGGPRFYVADNVDPERLTALFDVVDLDKTVFNVVSKSGSTVETMSQFLIVKDLLERELGREEAKKHLVCTTDASKGALRKLADTEGYRTFVIPDGVGGRFSELCAVGLLPAAVCGIDIAAMLEGAAEMDARCSDPDFRKNPAYLYGVLHCIAMEQGKNISVLMPYADSLKLVSDWYAQLWAESLGKKTDKVGNLVYCGQTPVKALGVTDQHSQVQLYTEGPFDKIVVFLGVEQYRATLAIPQGCEGLEFLSGVTHNQLISVEQWATEYALSRAGRPSMTLTLPEVNARTIGGLLYFFEVATAFAGAYLGIDAFNQPGVEAGKAAAYAYFGKPGYEAKKAELDALPPKNERYRI